MMGLKLFIHSVRMVFGNLKEVIQIGLVPYVLATVIAAVVLYSAGLDFRSLGSEDIFQNESPSTGQILSLFVVLIVYIFAALWMVVNWHRFILLEELPKGFFPPFHGGRILSYLGRSLLLAIIVVIPIVLIAIVFATVLIGPIASATWLFELIMSIAMAMLFFRLSPILPATAIGKSMKIGEAWKATKKATGAIFVSALLFVVIQAAGDWIAVNIYMAVPALGIVFDLFQNAATGMIGISILTTIYGHYVEGRELT